MKTGNDAGWCYVLSHPAWRSLGPAVKIGMTRRNPAKRAAEICALSGLAAPARIEFAVWIADRRAVELAVHRELGQHRIRRRELFRVDVATARAAIESAACRKAPVPIMPPLPSSLIPTRGAMDRKWRRIAREVIGALLFSAAAAGILAWVAAR